MTAKVGIIVDGLGDYASMKARFKHGYFVLKTDGPRGHEARPNQIAVASKKQIGILRAAKCAKVIVLVDVERRTESYAEFLAALRVEFGKIDYGVVVVACAANIMIENWYLADILELSKRKAYIKRQKAQKRYEGRHGKNELKKLMIKGVQYLETKHGPDLFNELSFVRARVISPSFDDFLDNVYLAPKDT